MVAVRPITLPAPLDRIAACETREQADRILAPHIDALGGLPDADAIVRIEIARWLITYQMMHPAMRRIMWLIDAEWKKHETGYYVDDQRRPLVLRTI